MYPSLSLVHSDRDCRAALTDPVPVPDCSWGEGYVRGFGFRVGVPGMSVRVSTRGVRNSVGPRAARLSVGSGGARMSTGLGPFYASSSLGGGRRRTSTRRTTRPRTVAPSDAQLDRVRRQAERAQQEAEGDAAIAQLRELKQQTTSVHLESFPTAHTPVISNVPQLGLPRALAEAQTFHLQGVDGWPAQRGPRPGVGQNRTRPAIWPRRPRSCTRSDRDWRTGQSTGGSPCSRTTRTPSARR